MPPEEDLEGLEKAEIDQIEAQKRQQEEDRLRELELARIQAELEAKLQAAKDLDADTEEARRLKAKLGDFLDAVSGQKKGLSAIRQKDIDSLRNLVADLDKDQLIHILRI